MTMCCFTTPIALVVIIATFLDFPPDRAFEGSVHCLNEPQFVPKIDVSSIYDCRALSPSKKSG